MFHQLHEVNWCVPWSQTQVTQIIWTGQNNLIWTLDRLLGLELDNFLQNVNS